MDIIYTIYYEVFSGGGYYLYHALDSIFGGWILFILCSTQYIRVVDTIYTMHHAVFSGGDTIYTMYYAIFSGVDINGYSDILSKKF